MAIHFLNDWRIRPKMTMLDIASNDFRRRHIAIHEASHAFAMFLLGLGIEEVRIFSEDDAEINGKWGHVIPAKCRMFLKHNDGYILRHHHKPTMEKEAMTYYAGTLGESLFLGQYLSGGATQIDDQEADECLRRFYPSEECLADAKQRLRKRTIRLLVKGAKAIPALSEELLSKGVLSGKEARAVLRRE